MDKVLNWAVAHQTGDKEAIEKAGTPDPKVLNQLFGGVDEAALMRSAIAIVGNDEATLENKEVAFDNFAMLVEDLDNANSIESLKLWPPIIEQLKTELTPLPLRVLAATSIGTALQNNPPSQEAFLKHKDGLATMINITADTKTPEKLLLKCVSALSSLLRNCEDASRAFETADGFKVLALTSTTNPKLLSRVCVLIASIISTGLDATKKDEFHKHKLPDLLASILKADSSVDSIDMALNIVAELRRGGFEFTKAETEALQKGLGRVSTIKDTLLPDDYALAEKALS